MSLIYSQEHSVYKNRGGFWLLFLLAQLSFLTTLGLPYQGEEGVYTITSMEMALNQEWTVPTLYGNNYARPPLFNWFIIPIAWVLGWGKVLIASRLVSGMATLLTSFLLVWFVEKITRDRFWGVFSALIYLSGDVLFRRGWLAYSDPLFSLFVFAAVCFLWIGMRENRAILFFASALCLIGSFLTKALTGYIFYIVALGVLSYRLPERKNAITVASIVAHLVAFGFPVGWSICVSDGDHGSSMIHDVIARLDVQSISKYISKILFYPFDTFARWFPVSGILLYFWLKNKVNLFENKSVQIALWICFLNYLPYWLAPDTPVRYLLPLFPLVAFVFSVWIKECFPHKIPVMFLWFVSVVVLRYGLGVFWFPYYEKHYRGNYQETAEDILRISQSEPLYTTDHSSVGLSVSAYIDERKMPEQVLIAPRGEFQRGFLISRTMEVPNAQVVKIYYFGRQKLYLLCASSTCPL